MSKTENTEATTDEAPKGPSKTQQVIEAVKATKGKQFTLVQLAETVGCTQGLVYEVAIRDWAQRELPGEVVREGRGVYVYKARKSAKKG